MSEINTTQEILLYDNFYTIIFILDVQTFEKSERTLKSKVAKICNHANVNQFFWERGKLLLLL